MHTFTTILILVSYLSHLAMGCEVGCGAGHERPCGQAGHEGHAHAVASPDFASVAESEHDAHAGHHAKCVAVIMRVADAHGVGHVVNGFCHLLLTGDRPSGRAAIVSPLDGVLPPLRSHLAKQVLVI